MARQRKFATTYQRVVERTAEPSNSNSCWLYLGSKTYNGYPKVTIRAKGKAPSGKHAHRLVMEEIIQAKFPLDECGHLCYNPSCVNPDHLEVQTCAMNTSLRRGYAAENSKRSWIPTLFPTVDPLQIAADDAWDSMFNKS